MPEHNSTEGDNLLSKHNNESEDNGSPTPGTPAENGDETPLTVAVNHEPTAADIADNEKRKKEAVFSQAQKAALQIAGVVNDNNDTQRTMFHAARGRVQRVIDVALLVSNMSRISTILRRQGVYQPYQVWTLCIALVFSIVAQIIAGVCFFITVERAAWKKKDKTWMDYTAFACVAFVMIINIFISTFDATWGVEVGAPIELPGIHNMTYFLEG